MYIGRVIGNIVSTAKIEQLNSAKLFIVEHFNHRLEPAGRYEISFDAIGIGIGDYVLVCSGSAGRMPYLTSKMPADSTIMARIDDFKKLKKEYFIENT
ncbi:MAG: EutN/CcmL family microcompartment protein [Actinomycetota bacterium]|jgi:ethanolamine utilization protein EutN|nr:EutN/CcmL family microcompartment protein [Actinomycetota bacterium]